MIFYNPQALARLRHEGSASRCYIGGSSKSSNTSQSSQVYNDGRQAIQNDSHAVTNTDSGNTSWMTALSDVGNSSTSLTSNTSTSLTNNSSTSLADSGNSWDSHAVNDSGNTSTVLNYTGTDSGALHIADMQSQFAQMAGEQNLDAVRVLSQLGANIGGNAAELASQGSQNAMTLSTHMLDITGDLIGKLASATASGAGAAATLATAGASTNATNADASTKKMMLIGGALVLAVMVLKK